jgi:hypothetical protein
LRAVSERGDASGIRQDGNSPCTAVEKGLGSAPAGTCRRARVVDLVISATPEYHQFGRQDGYWPKDMIVRALGGDALQ